MAVVVVTFESGAIAQNYSRKTRLPWPVLIDKSRKLYAAYGMERGRWWDIWGPASWWGYLRLIFRGRRLHRPTGDIHQLGGDVLIDPTGIVRLRHVGRGPIDRPSVDSLLVVVQSLSAQTRC